MEDKQTNGKEKRNLKYYWDEWNKYFLWGIGIVLLFGTMIYFNEDVEAAPVFDNALVNATVAQTTYNTTFTVGAGTNRYLGVWITMVASQPKSISSVKYNNVALTFGHTKTADNENFMVMEYWYLVNPDTGSNTLTIIGSKSMDMQAAITSWNGIDQTTPNGTIVSADDVIATASGSVIVTSAVNDIVVDATSSANTRNIYAGTGQTLRANRTGVSRNIAHSSEAGAASVNMSWDYKNTLNQAAADNWVIIAVPLKVAAAGDSCTPPSINNNWNTFWYDNCTVSSNVNLGEGNLSISGSCIGTFNLKGGNITANTKIERHESPNLCYVTTRGGHIDLR